MESVCNVRTTGYSSIEYQVHTSCTNYCRPVHTSVHLLTLKLGASGSLLTKHWVPQTSSATFTKYSDTAWYLNSTSFTATYLSSRDYTKTGYLRSAAFTRKTVCRRVLPPFWRNAGFGVCTQKSGCLSSASFIGKTGCASGVCRFLRSTGYLNGTT